MPSFLYFLNRGVLDFFFIFIFFFFIIYSTQLSWLLSGGVGEDGNEFGNDSGGEFGLLGLFLNGWRLRVVVDPQFAFKVLMEELVVVTACVLRDMGYLFLRLKALAFEGLRSTNRTGEEEDEG